MSSASGGVNGSGNCERSKNPSEDLPFKKRINTELFIDGKNGLYIQQ